MVSTRKVALLAATAFSAFGAVHCSAPQVSPADNVPTVQNNPSSNNESSNNDETPASTGTKTTTAARTATSTASATSTPVKVTKADAGATQSSGPGPTCQSLSTCCSKITNSLEQIGCLLAAGKSNELVCAGAVLTFQCSSLTTTTATGAATASHGPSCSGLTSGALYCGNDGANGDPNTLYRCTGTTISIASQCANGCTTNDGVDDACATTAAAATPSAGPSCDGLSGDYCGTDFVGGDANTLYTCDGTNAKPKTSQACANGCTTMTDNTNDSCATTPVATGTANGDNPCSDLPDFSYCGGDGITGNANTLYTCAGSTLTNTQICANGCTVGASNVSDFCSFSAGDNSTAPSCAGLDDGTYCGTNGPMGDASTLYTCSGGAVSDSSSCDSGCFAGDFGGSDSCN